MKGLAIPSSVSPPLINTPSISPSLVAAPPQDAPTLHDIHLPTPPSWWPPAPGWWVLAALVLLVLVIALLLWRRQRRAISQRQRVLREVDRLAEQHRHDHDPAALAVGLHQLLRRVARQHDPSAARQTGAAWRQTLARVSVDDSTLDRLLELDQFMYRAQPSFDHAAAVNGVKVWLRVALKPSAWKAPLTEQADA
ncbi:MAG: DUF4381 domain-containing protein [Pseudomonadota bacterium]|nr:DUF4381 domain-containing protein [Pseudomonadota bacterium]